MINIVRKEDCCGCGACVQRCPQSCIVMNADEDGFLYPSADKSQCVDCGLCERVCPLKLTERDDTDKVDESRYAGRLVYAAANDDDKRRMDSSSGGVFSLLAERVIGLGGIVFGAAFDDCWAVRHISASSMEDIGKLLGSKYVQSRIGSAYNDVERFLKAGRWVLFSGTPCQILGLHSFLRHSYDKLLTVDVVCHGVPSPAVWQRYLGEIKHKHKADIKAVSFRDKARKGWVNYGLRIDFDDDTAFHEFAKRNVFLRGFVKDLYLRHSCYECRAKGGASNSDITLGDFWGIENLHPDIYDDKGVSLVMTNTEKGKCFFESLQIAKKETDAVLALRYNSSYYQSVDKPVKRDQFFYMFSNGLPVSRIVETLLHISIWNRALIIARNIIVKVFRLAK